GQGPFTLGQLLCPGPLAVALPLQLLQGRLQVPEARLRPLAAPAGLLKFPPPVQELAPQAGGLLLPAEEVGEAPLAQLRELPLDQAHPVARLVSLPSGVVQPPHGPVEA